MKVLLYHPKLHAEHPWIKNLQAKGHAVLWSASFDEVLKLATAHAKSLDLLISNREDETGKKDIGFARVSEIKKIKSLEDLPWIGLTDQLSEKELAAHQDTSHGANAYLRNPFKPAQLIGLIDTVMGTGDGTQFVLEESPFAQSEPSQPTQTGSSHIRLDLPNLDDFDLDLSEDSAASESKNVSESSIETSQFNPSEPIELSQIIEPLELASTQEQTGQMLRPIPLEEEPVVKDSPLEAVDDTPLEKPAVPPPFSAKSEKPKITPPAFKSPPPSEPPLIESEDLNLSPINDEISLIEDTALNHTGLDIEPLSITESPEVIEDTGILSTALLDTEPFIVEGIENLEGQPEPTELNWSPELPDEAQALTVAQAPNELSMVDFTSALSEPILPVEHHLDEAQAESERESVPQPELGPVTPAEELPPTQLIPSFEAGMTLQAEAPSPALEVSDTAPTPPAPVDAEKIDSESESVMSYLFQKPPGRESRRPVEIASVSAETAFAQPVGDAVVPGGAAQTPDLETLKQYLLLREQDVGVLSSQLRSAKIQIQNLEQLLEMEHAKNSEVTYQLEHHQKKISEFETLKEKELDELRSEISDLKFQIKTRADKIRGLETEMRNSADELSQIRERVKSDIRKIRVREKELENRLEIMKKDSEALIVARENKIIELKRKIDLLEFNLDIVQERYHQEKQHSAILKEKLGKAAQIVRAAGGLLDHSEISSATAPENKYKAS